MQSILDAISGRSSQDGSLGIRSWHSGNDADFISNIDVAAWFENGKGQFHDVAEKNPIAWPLASRSRSVDAFTPKKHGILG